MQSVCRRSTTSRRTYLRRISFDPGEAPGEIFGSNVFTQAEMRLRLPKSVYKSVVATIEKGAKLDPAVADSVASVMKDWAL